MPLPLAARLMRAKAEELENRTRMLIEANADPDLWVLTADVGLIAELLAELIERVDNG